MKKLLLSMFLAGILSTFVGILSVYLYETSIIRMMIFNHESVFDLEESAANAPKTQTFTGLSNPSVSNVVPADQSHVSLIFDSKRRQNAIGALNSLIYVARREGYPLPSLHLVTTPSQQAMIKSNWSFYQEYQSQIHFYDFSVCRTLVAEARAFSPNIHVSAHCKFYLHLVLPANVRSVLFVDNDVAFVGFPQKCMPQMNEGEMISMAPDMGDICLSQPQRCWPTGFVARVPPNLVCGNDNSIIPVNGSCAHPGQIVPYHFNGGVVYLNLEQMRKADFRSRYEEHIWKRVYSQGLKPAEWGEQCYINSFFSEHPSSLRQLPCSCNYQFTGARRRVLCPHQPVTVVHAWKYGLNTNDPYSRYIGHFMECNGDDCFTEIPHVRNTSLGRKIETSAYVPLKVESDVTPAPLKKPMFSIITRTANRPTMVKAAISSVQNQVYQNFFHIIGIELDEGDTDYISPLPPKTLVIRTPRSPPIDVTEPCRVCKSTPGKCLNAPPISQPEKRQKFLECFCTLSFPGNGAFEILHKHVPPDSYVVYLDDDNMLIESSTLLKMADVIAMTPDSESKLFIAASHLGRITPTFAAMSTKTMAQGDIDASNLVFHANHVSKTGWGRERCGDWRTARNLHAALESVWITDFMLIAANPFRDSVAGSQGGGMRQDGSMVSVLFTSMSNRGYRAQWLYRAIALFLSDSYAHVVGEVILIWNNPEEDPPELPPKTRVLKMTKNSLNNRWTTGLQAARYNKILNLDDDMEVSLTGMMCMFHILRSKPHAIVGPYARIFSDEGTYSMSEQRNYNLPYRMILPRVLMAEKSTLVAYSNWARFFDYVDNQAAHCDDVLLNLAVNHNQSEVIRVAFPAESIGDYWQSCMNETGVKAGGIAGQGDRSKLRAECIREFLTELKPPPVKTSVYQCANYGLVTGRSDYGFSSEVYESSIYLPECT